MPKTKKEILEAFDKKVIELGGGVSRASAEILRAFIENRLDDTTEAVRVKKQNMKKVIRASEYKQFTTVGFNKAVDFQDDLIETFNKQYEPPRGLSKIL